MNIKFYPASDEPVLIAAAAEYRAIWEADGNSFVNALETQTDLTFPKPALNALVFEGTSRSHPLILRASYLKEVKEETVVHELGHRLLSANGLRAEFGQDFHVNSHKLLYLFLFEVYLELFGEERAHRAVELESSRRPSYRECWRWALELSKTERVRRFERIKQNRDGWLPHLKPLQNA